MSASAEKRVALVIGNANYAVGSVLANPANDARAISSTLRRLAFEVTTYVDLRLIEMGRALADFAVAAEAADIALIYFAGHGIEVDGQNYLLPVDAVLDHAKRLPHEAKKLADVADAVDNAKRLGLIILDACRDNPYRGRMRGLGGGRSVAAGLAAVEPQNNVLVAYAARHGTQARDGAEGANSPYARALVENLETPNLDVRLLFGRVRDRVLALTANSQEPHIYGTLGGEEIYLRSVAGSGAGGRAEQASAPDHRYDRAVEMAHWQAISTSQRPADFRDFIEKYGLSDFAGLARKRLAAHEAMHWRRIEWRHSPALFTAFLADFPDGAHAADAQRKLQLGDKPRGWAAVPWLGIIFAIFALPIMFSISGMLMYRMKTGNWVGTTPANTGVPDSVMDAVIPISLLVGGAVVLILAGALVHWRRARLRSTEISLYWLGCALTSFFPIMVLVKVGARGLIGTSTQGSSGCCDEPGYRQHRYPAFSRGDGLSLARDTDLGDTQHLLVRMHTGHDGLFLASWLRRKMELAGARPRKPLQFLDSGHTVRRVWGRLDRLAGHAKPLAVRSRCRIPSEGGGLKTRRLRAATRSSAPASRAPRLRENPER